MILLSHTSYPLDCSNQIPLADIARSIVGSHPTVLFNYKKIPLRDLLYFDLFYAIDEPTLQELFFHRQCMTSIKSSTLRLVCDLIREGGHTLTKVLLNQASTQPLTYKQLYEELSQYSIFTNGNLYVS